MHVAVSVEGLPGALNRITTTVTSAPGARCGLTVNEARPPPALVRQLAAGLGGVAAGSARSPGTGARWVFLATCRQGSRWRLGWRYHPNPACPDRGRLRERPGHRRARSRGTDRAEGTGTCDPQGICFAADPYPVGQCTWYALGRRPDLAGIVSGNASAWLQAAAGKAPEGSPSRLPALPGALAVWAATPARRSRRARGVRRRRRRGARRRLLIDDSNWTPTPQSPGLQVHEHWVPAAPVEGYIYPSGYHPAG